MESGCKRGRGGLQDLSGGLSHSQVTAVLNVFLIVPSANHPTSFLVSSSLIDGLSETKTSTNGYFHTLLILACKVP